MRKRIDYLPLCEKALESLQTINRVLEYLEKYELPRSTLKNIIEIKELTEVAEIPIETGILSNIHKLLFEGFVQQIVEIEDNLREMLMVNGDIMKKLGRLPEEERENVCSILDIEFTPTEDRMSDELKLVIHKLLEKIEGLHEVSRRYYSMDKEQFVDFQDEMSNE
ncbi:hypothetical protein COV20_00125 [Candidatus Woesearchaeota archaeon CG10_big_fil_rev_8_21_14_0_10_45_16]|nr:MAG: hypothetical protein COV20_00125 [Candidatus Woesearchaeota archaeon CG10_big_fil_rev_8_21_14_0_10_45_16]